MEYVFSEIVPWIALAFAAGLLIGLLFWWARLWLRRRSMVPEHVRGLSSYEVEGSNQVLASQIEQLQRENAQLQERVEALNAAAAADASARVRMKDLEDANNGLRDRVIELEALVPTEDAGPSESDERIAQLERENASLTDQNRELDALHTRVRELEQRNSLLVGQLEAGVTPQGFLSGTTSSTEEPTEPVAATIEDPDAARSVLGFLPTADDLKVVEGIGPKISELCNGIGIRTWHELAEADPETLREMLDDAGPRFRVHDPGTWPEQARLLAENRWQEFKDLTNGLSGGR